MSLQQRFAPLDPVVFDQIHSIFRMKMKNKTFLLIFCLEIHAFTENECEIGTHTCKENQRCLNTAGGHLCVCKDGYTLDGPGCIDINECDLGLAICHEKASCKNTIGSYECICEQGFYGDGKSNCDDIDECFFDPCNENADCFNFEGTFHCECADYFIGDGLTCEEYDECAYGDHTCDLNANCVNHDLGYSCSCRDGFEGHIQKLNGNLKS